MNDVSLCYLLHSSISIIIYSILLCYKLFNYLIYRTGKDKYLKDLARDNTQILLNSIWELPTEKVENNIVAKLPKSKFILPREKPAPKPKPLTKWQTFAKEKGIKTTKKSRITWDEVLNVSTNRNIEVYHFHLFYRSHK